MVSENQTPAPDLSTRIAFSVAEAAQVTGLREKVLYAALNAGQLKGRRVTARRWVIARSALDAYLTTSDSA